MEGVGPPGYHPEPYNAIFTEASSIHNHDSRVYHKNPGTRIFQLTRFSSGSNFPE